MLDRLSDLLEYVEALDLDDAAKADLIHRAMSVGQGAPQAAGGSRYDELTRRLLERYPAPSGPGGPRPPPPPPVVPEEPPAFVDGLNDDAPDTRPKGWR